MPTPTRSWLMRAVLFFAFLAAWFALRRPREPKSDADRDLEIEAHLRNHFTHIET